jgi:hypothetical protein
MAFEKILLAYEYRKERKVSAKGAKYFFSFSADSLRSLRYSYVVALITFTASFKTKTITGH